MPKPLFTELKRRGTLVGTADADLTTPLDLVRGLVDWRRSIQARRPRRSAIWRYLPENIDRLSERFRAVQRSLPEHDIVLQFGVAGVPDLAKPLLAHVEIPVSAAISSPVFARSYGFSGLDDRQKRLVVDGERRFLDRCTFVWTNTAWTASLLETDGVDSERLRVCPPACTSADPGNIERSWDECHILFIGKDWRGKGGDVLVEAFRSVRRVRPDATLTIVGCSPRVNEPGVTVLGFLNRDVAVEAQLLHNVLGESTIFCMPSQWESTGLVYLEAALYGLPVVMLAGQGRDALFPREMAVVVERAGPRTLAEALLDLGSSPDRMSSMGRSGRGRVLADHMLPSVAERVQSWLVEAMAEGVR